MEAQSGEHTSQFVQLMLRAQPRIYAYIRTQITRRADAEDVLQETVTVLWTKFDQFEPGSDFLAWAYQVARFKVRHFYRSRQKLELQFADSFLDLVAESSENLGEELSDMQQALADCMARLQAADRDVLQRCYGTESTIRSVAQELGRPLDTIKSVLKRSRRALFDCISRTIRRETP